VKNCLKTTVSFLRKTLLRKDDIVRTKGSGEKGFQGYRRDEERCSKDNTESKAKNGSS